MSGFDILGHVTSEIQVEILCLILQELQLFNENTCKSQLDFVKMFQMSNKWSTVSLSIKR